jgi:hypothetical protein
VTVLLGIAISPFVIPHQYTHRDKGIEEVARCATVDLNALSEIAGIKRATYQLRKNAEFDRAQ